MPVDRTPRGDGPTTYRMQSMHMPTPNYTPPGQEPPQGCRTPVNCGRIPYMRDKPVPYYTRPGMPPVGGRGWWIGPLLGVAVLVAAFLIWGIFG